MIEGYCAQNTHMAQDFDISPSNGPFDDGALRSNVLEFMMELITRPLVLDQCPAWEDPRGWPDVSQAGPFAHMESAACKRYAFLSQHNLPRTLKGYLAIPIPIRACIDNCYSERLFSFLARAPRGTIWVRCTTGAPFAWRKSKKTAATSNVSRASTCGGTSAIMF